jgi:HSP20 family protein
MNVVRFNNRFPTVFDQFLREFEVPQSERAFTPKADVIDHEKSIEIHLDLPGVNPDAIEVKLDENVLTVSVDRKLDEATEKKGFLRRERNFGTFTRSFTLPNTVDGSKPDAAYRHGVLTLTLPKKEEVLPKTFKVRVEA